VSQQLKDNLSYYVFCITFLINQSTLFWFPMETLDSSALSIRSNYFLVIPHE